MHFTTLNYLFQIGNLFRDHSLEGKTKASKNPNEVYSLAWAAWIIGRIGGWKGYRKAGPAGPITMKRGMQKFSILFEGWKLHEASEVAQLDPSDCYVWGNCYG